MVTASEQPTALLDLRDVRRSYGGTGGAPTVDVLRGVSLQIHSGEFVAIVGASGSGKSTLMHILGCLDKPTSGAYLFAGQDIANFDPDELAWLRRNAFGFVFQGYHLIRTLSALQNVEVPAVYAGKPLRERDTRGTSLLARLGLDDRLHHRPHQLSGGQQQRVSIARALMNGGHIILADEPTGALDSRSGRDVMALLSELAAEGHTVILITHDRAVAAQAHRIIEIHDGRVIGDHPAEEPACARTGTAAMPGPAVAPPRAAHLPAHLRDIRAARDMRQANSTVTNIFEALRAAWIVLWINRFRTLLTLLGIIIGVASVIVMLAVGAGTQATVLAKLATFGVNRMYVIPGSGNNRGPGGTLSEADAKLIARVPNVDVAMPFYDGKAVVRAGNVDVTVPIWAVTTDATKVLSWNVKRGVFFNKEDERNLATVAVIGREVARRLFGRRNPLGTYILVNNVPFQVIGVLHEKGATSGQSDDDDTILIPGSTGSRRILGTANPSWISILIDNLDKADETARNITLALTDSHHVEDFQVLNQAASVKAQTETQQTLTMMLGLIAAVSLIVGGIGIMNIMLMTVKERTREIGIRMATGARQRDILRQFLSEAVLVSTVGGLAGVVIGLSIGAALVVWDVPLIFSMRAILAAFACALGTGLVFGFTPARKAARLDPVAALASE